jgi:hypothetical protein
MSFGAKYWLFLLIILSSSVLAQIQITEIMYAPTFNYQYNEWIEIYNAGDSEINLNNWTLCGKTLSPGYIDHEDNKLKLNTTLILSAGSYAIITDGQTGTEVYSNFAVDSGSLALHVNVASLCTGLKNSGDSIFLENETGNLINSITYDDTWGANGNNKTLVKEGDLWRESYIDFGTPGMANSEQQEIVVLEEPSEPKAPSEETEETTQKASPRFEIDKFPNTTIAGNTVNLKFLIFNGDARHQFKVWAYIYKGNKCYSCVDKEREDNQQIVLLEPREERTFKFKFKLPEDMVTDDYKLKVRVIKDDQKTSKDFKEVIHITEIVKEETELELQSEQEQEPIKKNIQEVSAEKEIVKQETKTDKASIPNKITGETIYESKNGKIKKIIPYTLIIVFGLLAIVFTLKR